MVVTDLGQCSVVVLILLYLKMIGTHGTTMSNGRDMHPTNLVALPSLQWFQIYWALYIQTSNMEFNERKKFYSCNANSKISLCLKFQAQSFHVCQTSGNLWEQICDAHGSKVWVWLVLFSHECSYRAVNSLTTNVHYSSSVLHLSHTGAQPHQSQAVGMDQVSSLAFCQLVWPWGD